MEWEGLMMGWVGSWPRERMMIDEEEQLVVWGWKGLNLNKSEKKQ